MSEDERLFLVVDPEARTHRALEAALTDQGGRVMVRESADQALEVLCSEPIDVVIASTTLADGDGFRLCSLMRGEVDFDPIPLMFLSDETSKSRRLEALQSGAADYLSKPFFFDELQMRISALLARDVRVASGAAWSVTEGTLADRSLVDILSEVEQEGQTGTLSVAREGREAVVHFQNGQIAGAVSGTLEGKEALLGLVAWPSGEYVLRTIEGDGDRDLDPEEVVLVSIRPLEAWSEVVDGLARLRRVFEAEGKEAPEVSGFDAADVAGVYELFDGERTLGEVISTSQPDLVVTLRIVDRLLEGEWLEGVEEADEVEGPGEGEPKPDFAQWIDPTGWSAEAVLDGEVEEGDFLIVPEQERAPVSVLKSDSEPEMVTDSEAEEEPELEQGVDTTLESKSGPTLEADSEPESTLESDSGPELDSESGAGFEEGASVTTLKSDSTPKFAVVEGSEVEESEVDDDGASEQKVDEQAAEESSSSQETPASDAPEGPQPHDRHEPGTIEHVELALDRRGYGASQRRYSEKHEEPPSERIEPAIPTTDPEPEVTDETTPTDGDEPLEKVETDEADDDEQDVLGPDAETPVMGLEAAPAEAEVDGLELDAADGGEEVDETDEAIQADQEEPTDELPRQPVGDSDRVGDRGERDRREQKTEPSDREEGSAAYLWVGVAVLLVVALVAGTYLIGGSTSGAEEEAKGTLTAEAETGEVPDQPLVDPETDEQIGEPADPGGLDEPTTEEPDLQIVEDTRRSGRQTAEQIVAVARKVGPASTGEGESDRPEKKALSANDDSASPNGTSVEQSGGSEKTSETASNDSKMPAVEQASDKSESATASTADRPNESADNPSVSSDPREIEAVASKIDQHQYAAAERQLETLADRLQQDAKVRDLYLDLAAGYQTEAKNVAAARRVYQEYLKLFPDGKYASEVRSILARLNGE